MKKTEDLINKLVTENQKNGYWLNPDREFVGGLAEGLITNETRYGYQACPCRLASGIKENDLDIICPCDYRDEDVAEFGNCYCALYVSKEMAKGKKMTRSIPERRPSEEIRINKTNIKTPKKQTSLKYPVWRCRVCGYICARNEAPDNCPICQAEKDRFERFI